ncbi:uncharacterized protein [Ptychodera flava]|uniref:uncharacterized protein n=1 Tax=Ptychodera flava TaxID=63121 RepID=UPI003969DDEC
MAIGKRAGRFKVVLLHCLELIVTPGVITPCVVGYWRGVWNLLNMYLFPNHPDISYIMSALSGLALILVFGITQNFHKRRFPFTTVRWHIYSRLYSFLMAFAFLNHWRGLWSLLNFYTSTSLSSTLSSLVIGTTSLVFLRGVKNVALIPSFVYRDHEDTVFDCSTRFNVNCSGETVKLKLLFIADLLVSFLFINSFVVFFWRGVWGTLDNLLLPHHKDMSSYASVVIGYGTFIACYLLQYPTQIASVNLAQKPFPLHLLFEDVYMLVAGFGAVNIWRGLWYVYDLHILPENFTISNVITAAVGTVILYLLLAGRCLGVCGCAVDGDRSDGSGILFSHFFGKLNEPLKPSEEQSNLADHGCSTVI